MSLRNNADLWSRATRLALLVTLTLGFTLSAGCATTFIGDAHYQSPRKCFKTCKRWNMKMAGYVFMGHYSSACVCEVKGSSAQRKMVIKAATAGTGAAAAGVVMQTRRAVQAQQSQ